MSLVFKTKPGSTDRVEIAGVGLLGADGEGGKLVSAAANQLQELMNVDLPTVEHPRGTPLEGDELKAAAEKFAEDRDLEVVDVSDAELGTLNVGIGSLGEFTPAIEVAEGEARRAYGDGSPPEDGQDSGTWTTAAASDATAPATAPSTPASPPESPASTPASSPAASPPASSAAGASSGTSSSGASSAAATTTP